MEAHRVAQEYKLIGPVMEQPQYNMFERKRLEGDYIRFYKEYSYGTTTWSPLASGFLSGKYKEGIPSDSRAALKNYKWLEERMTDKARLAKVAALEPIAKDLGCTMSQLALAWCLKNPFVSTVITGASRVEQVHENMKASEIAPKITQEIMDKIDTIFEIKKEEEDD